MPTDAVTSPGRLSTPFDAATRSIEVAPAQATTAAIACATVSMITRGPAQACHRASRWAPMSRSSHGDRDIKINMIAAPYPAAIPVTWDTKEAPNWIGNPIPTKP